MRNFTFCFLFVLAAVILSLLVNALRVERLPFHYSDAQSRIDKEVSRLRSNQASVQSANKDITLEEVEAALREQADLIVDARPQIFYNAGHIPSAISLPRDDFSKYYRNDTQSLEAHIKDEIIVYCSAPDCQDSRMVATALRSLGFSNVRVFTGGWSTWRYENLPVER